MTSEHASDLHLPAMVRDLTEERPKRRRERPLGLGHTRVVEPPPVDRGLTPKERKVLLHHAMRNRDLTSFSLRVLGELDIPANPKNLCVWVSANTIAETLGALPTTVHHSLKELEARGYIVIQRDNCPCGKKGTHYRLAALLFDEDAYLDSVQSQDEVARASAQLSKEAAKALTQTAKASNGIAKASIGSATGSTAYIEHVKEPSNEPVSSPSTSTKSPGPESPPKKRDKVKELLDRCTELGVDQPSLRQQDMRALKLSMAEPALVAEAWAAARSQRWRDDWVQKNMTIQVILGKIDVYKLWLERGGSRAPQRQGASNLGPSAKDAATPGFYDDLLDEKFRGLGAVLNNIEYLKKLFQEKHGHDVRTPCPTPCYTPPADYYQGGKS